MKLSKFKLVSAITAITLVGGGLTLPLISNSIKTNTITTNQTNNIDITANKNDASTNLQVVNSVDEIVVEDVNIIKECGYAIVKNNGIQEVYAWGKNGSGQLGVGDRVNKPNPTKVALPNFDTNTVIKSFDIVDNIGHILLEKNGAEKLYVWGINQYGKLGIGDTNESAIYASPTEFPLTVFGSGVIRKIAFNTYSCYAIIDRTNNQTDIYVWGYNAKGLLGIGNDSSNKHSPILLPLSSTKHGWNLQNAEISSRNNGISSYALYEQNGVQELYVWGYNHVGQLGVGNQQDMFTPQLIPTSRFNDGRIISFRFEIGYMSWALVEIGGVKRLYTCGSNDRGQLGQGSDSASLPISTTHAAIPRGHFNDGEIIDVASYGNAGFSMYAIVNVNDVLQIYTWGENYSGQIGNNSTTDVPTPYAIPTSIFNNGIIESYSFGDGNAMVVVRVDNKQQVFVWGYNAYGYLGLNSTTNISIPTRLNNPLFNESNIVLPKSLTSIDNTMFSLQKDGKTSYYISGINSSGQLGDGTTTNKLVHVRILPKNNTELLMKESEKITILKANVSATDAMQSINSSDILSRTALEKYVDLSSFPLGATLSIDTDKTKINYELGIIDLVINTTSYYGPFSYIPVAENKLFSITITGFRPIKDFPIIAKTAPTLNAIEFYDYVIASDKTNRMFLEQYLDLSCIPLDAEIVIEPLKTTDINKIEFILKTNKVYKNNGTTTLENYEQLFSFNLDQNTTPIQKDSSSIGLDSTVIIGLIIGGCVLAVIILTSIYAFAHKTKYY